ncbi:MAG: hypothetical protein HRF40_00550 [Nitrososphaera sp.]|jgi:hypothetical protein
MAEPDVFSDLVDYFQSYAEEFEYKAKRAGLFQIKVDTGGLRETIMIDFLERHLPANCRVRKGGRIIDSTGNQSRQVDVLVTNN